MNGTNGTDGVASVTTSINLATIMLGISYACLDRGPDSTKWAGPPAKEGEMPERYHCALFVSVMDRNDDTANSNEVVHLFYSAQPISIEAIIADEMKCAELMLTLMTHHEKMNSTAGSTVVNSVMRTLIQRGYKVELPKDLVNQLGSFEEATGQPDAGLRVLPKPEDEDDEPDPEPAPPYDTRPDADRGDDSDNADA